MDALTGIRTPVLTLKGSRPGPLDDEGVNCSLFSECLFQSGGILPPQGIKVKRQTFDLGSDAEGGEGFFAVGQAHFLAQV